ncbi:MAG: GMC family oxidoreductase [Rubrivivax sp.]|nr:GMC family oxidoreductase [Rubrivivax sp.]
MFCDARRVEDAMVAETTVCIIGGGAAGLTMALEFERRGIGTIVLESGGRRPDPLTMDLYRGESVGIPYHFGDNYRSRFLGGCSNCWGGWCRPMDAEDFQKRDWVPGSGWPFGIEELNPFYERAHRVLRLGPTNYDIDHWVEAIGRKDVRRMPLPSGELIDSISQFSPPLRFGRHHRRDLGNARHVRVFLHANVVDIETGADGREATRVHVRTLTGKRMSVKARYFVLACGGIENARILLACNKQHGAGLGNSSGLVGRYFMDHPRLLLGKMTLREPWRRNKLYDIMFHYLNRDVRADGIHIAAQLTVAPEVQRRERMLNSRIWFSSIFPGEGTAAADALKRMKFRLTGKIDPSHSFWRDMGILMREPVNAANFVAARQLRPVGFLKEMHFQMIKEARFQMICEPAPDPDSRVTLADSKDALGMPRARVDWRLGDMVKYTFDRTVAIVGKEVGDAGIAEVAYDPPQLGREWPESLEGTWHHMGTTRMNDSPTQGVVDRHGRMHDLANLYVGGSSVFPTAGANFPTITLVALALRMSDHIAARISQPDAVAAAAPPRVPAAEPAAVAAVRT